MNIKVRINLFRNHPEKANSIAKVGFWQRGRDSNPRYPLGLYTLSRRAPSTTRTPLCVEFSDLFSIGVQRNKYLLAYANSRLKNNRTRSLNYLFMLGVAVNWEAIQN